MKRFLLSVCVLCAGILSVNAQLIKNDFTTGLVVGGVVEKGAYAGTDQPTNPIMLNQWNLSGKTGANDQSGENPLAVAALTYAGYVDSNAGTAIELLKLGTGGRTSIYSLADDNTYGAGTYYITTLFNVTAASPTSAAEFLSLDGNFTGNAQRVRFTVKGFDETTFQIGLGDTGAASAVYGSFNYGQTYIVVIKVTIDGTGIGSGSVFVNPDLTSNEAAATVLATTPITGTALKSIRGLVIRQRSTIAAQVGGIRFAQSWEAAVGQSLVSIDENNVDKGNIVSTKYYTISGVEVNQVSATGVYIQKNTYENGEVEVLKKLSTKN